MISLFPAHFFNQKIITIFFLFSFMLLTDCSNLFIRSGITTIIITDCSRRKPMFTFKSSNCTITSCLSCFLISHNNIPFTHYIKLVCILLYTGIISISYLDNFKPSNALFNSLAFSIIFSGSLPCDIL